MTKKLIAALTMLSLASTAQAGPADTTITQAKTIQGVPNVNQPEPNRYNGGQPESFEAVAQAGVKHVINMRPPEETPEINEPALVTAQGMAYYNIPIASGADLSRENVEIFDRLLSDIGDEPVLVHCASSNRVGALAALRAAWLQDKSKEQALEVGESWGLTSMQPAIEKMLSQ